MSKLTTKAGGWLAVPLIVLSFSGRAFAQTTGVITGTITDVSEAVVAGADVTVRNVNTGEERAVQTNASGQYVVNALPVGEYEVEAGAAGFKKTKRVGIQLAVADRLAINLRLEVGEKTDTVAVNDLAPVVETEKGDVSYLVNTKQITDHAINGRTFTLLQQLAPGASRTVGDEGGVGFNSNKGFAINGQRPDRYGRPIGAVRLAGNGDD